MSRVVQPGGPAKSILKGKRTDILEIVVKCRNQYQMRQAMEISSASPQSGSKACGGTKNEMSNVAIQMGQVFHMGGSNAVLTFPAN